MKKLDFRSVVIGFLILVFSCWFCQACSEEISDTCTQGENMSNIHLVGDFNPASDRPTLIFEWDIGSGKGAKLPDEYFNEVELDYDNIDYEVLLLIDSVAYTNQNEITVFLNNITAYIEENNILTFSLAFPDRRGFINCEHPGMDDRYLLII